MKKYGELIQFEPVTTIIKLKESAEQHKAQQLVASYVISDKMALKLADIIIPQLQFEESVDNKSLWVVGNYGSGKSHLMSVISAVAEFPELAKYITNDKVRHAAGKIAGKFKVIRFEVGASKKAFADIVTDNLTSSLAEMGIDYQFPSMDEISSNHKPYFEEMMALFHQRYPDQGLLLICDEILDYLRSRNQQQLPLDMAMMRVMGEVIDGTRFRFICGVQEAIFDSTQLAFATQEVKRIRDRAEQVLITRDDIKYVVAERLLKKDAQQLHWIREYLQQFTSCFDRMNERLDEFVRMFPVHPDYINTFERVHGAGIEQRQVLRSLSRQMQALMEQQVPLDKPGVFSYDTYWDELRSDPSAKTNPDVGQVIDVGETLFTRIDQAYPTATEIDFAKRLVAGLAIHRLTVGDVYNEMGATAAELRDSLCLYLPGIEQLPGEKSKNLETQIVAVLTKIRKTVNGQFFSKNKANDQFFLDLKKTEDFDAYIENKIPLLTDDSRNGAYREAMLQILEETDMQQPNIQMWQHELKWLDRNVNRPGWMFLGSPNERETAKPPLDYYMYFIQPYNPPKQKKEHIRSDEVLFILQNADGDFDRSLNYYAAAIDLHASATGNAKNVYKLKADGYLREMQTWLKSHFKDAYIAQYNGQSKPMMDWLKGTSVRNISGLSDNHIGSLKDIFESIASHILANHFVSLAPEYPTFSQWITYENIESAAKDALSVVSGGAATKRANAVLDALELLDGEKISPLQSRYAQAVLAVLQSKPQGHVVNQSELLEAINSRLYFKPEIFRLEPEWLLVLIACLVYSGELELVVVGHTLTASDVVKFKSISFDVLKDFKHIQAPKDFNITALKSLLALLDMNDGLATSIQQGDESIVREMLKRTDLQINELVKGQQSVKERLPLWGQLVLEENEEQTLSTQLTELKNFLESIQRYDKPGKLKNLKVTASEIATYHQMLQAWRNFLQIKMSVNELAPLCTYLKEAQLVLPEQHMWQEQVKLARDVLRQGFADPSLRDDENFKATQISVLTGLKTEYAKHYIELYLRAHLDSREEETKSRLLHDERLTELDILSGITLLPAQQLVNWRKDAAQLQAAKPIDPKQLSINANPVDFNARQESSKAPASEQLKNLEQRLDSLQNEWLSNLNSLLDDPFINLDLLKPSQAQLIRDFIQRGQLPEQIGATFVEAVNLVLAGLEELQIKSSELINALGQGLPQSRDEISERFSRLLDKLCQGKDINKVRIIIN